MSAVAFVLVIVAMVITTTTRAHLLDQVDNRLASIGNPGPGLGLNAAEQLSRQPDPPERFSDIPERFSDIYMGVLRTNDELVTMFASNLGGDGDLPIPDIDPDAARDAAAAGELFSTGSLGDDGLRYRVSAREVPDGAVFVTAFPLSDVDDAVARLVTVETIATTIILAALGLVTWWVLRLGIRPIKRMTDVASSIAGGDLSQRVPESASSTEAGQLGVALNQMLGRIEDAFDVRARSEDRLRQFVADASHELRTPVTTIRGYAELFRSGGLGEPSELEEAMRRTEQEAIRMGRLVDDMLTLAKLDQDRPLETRSVDLAVLMSDAARDAAAVAPGRSIRTDIEGPVVVTGDEDRLRQVLANVVGNALVHTPLDSAIELHLRRDGACAVVDVVDHGPGMPPEIAARVTERFFRADPSRTRHRGGSGLGLSIADTAIDAHGGDIRVHSVAGVGTTVRITLPVGAA
jgi:two-component system OmpR family sensor kinase